MQICPLHACGLQTPIEHKVHGDRQISLEPDAVQSWIRDLKPDRLILLVPVMRIEVVRIMTDSSQQAS
jgi:hypothetical protein